MALSIAWSGSLRLATRPLLAALVLCSALLAHAQQSKAEPGAPAAIPATTFEPQFPPLNNNYEPTADSLVHPGVPAGALLKFELSNSHIFPSTVHAITVYVPAEYKGDKPACVFLFLDGIGFDAPVVFDNLIAAHQMPVTIAIGIQAGAISSASNPNVKRYDRSLEFDSRNDRLARFILNEVLPAVEAQKTRDGRSLLLSTDPNDRAIAGSSTGGIAAFNVAWQRPDAFRRVFTSVGTFVGMRGGDRIYVQVRKTEPKPIRVFMVDGAHDGWPGGLEMGDWWMANLTLERALAYAGYDVHHEWGSGAHNGKLATQVFPQAVRWLFRDYPAPVAAGSPGNHALQPLLIDGEPWKVVLANCPEPPPLAGGPDGTMFLAASANGTSKLTTASTCDDSTISALALGPDGGTYVAVKGGRGLTKVAADGAKTPIAAGLDVTALTLTSQGLLYIAAKSSAVSDTGEIWLVHPDGLKLKVAEGLKTVSALAVSPDSNWLIATQPSSHLSYSYRVRSDGTLDAGEPFYYLDVPAAEDGSGAKAVAMDREGRAYIATKLGVQICDHNGRVTGILPLPGNRPAEALAFGGDGFTTLYVAGGGKIYARKLKIGGIYPAAAPIPIPDWGAG